jgi:hypothetical protein
MYAAEQALERMTRIEAEAAGAPAAPGEEGGTS